MSFYCVELPYQSDAARYFAALADLPWAVWLDSGGMARYDILSAAPQRSLSLDAAATEIDPFALVRSALGELIAPIADVPFAGGALGYWSYDLARSMYALPGIAQDDVHQEAGHLPDMAIGIYDWALVLDHHRQTARLVSRRRFAETAELLPQILLRLQSNTPLPDDTFRVRGKISSNFTPESYARAFAAVQGYLKSGDCYQINLAQRFSATATGDALRAYFTLRSLSPAPYSAFLNLPKAQILCASPERFLRVQNGSVETRPIKGTRPRSSDAQQDSRLADELRNHPKDRAENLMIVDLLRSDLGKSCVPGSVRVPELFAVESYASVHHLVSTVEGRLAEGRDALDVLRDCFPGGSVTGAPKQRAMQIIEQLEPHHRGIYCGAIGYAGFDGNMDTNIVIRTLVYSGNEIRCWAGGGIVADSEVTAEYQETLDKAAGMLRLLRQYGGESGS
ncbi:MAG: aminodeoxychorismate synthase, component I [Gallionellales bacterium RIFCSPLOWO2_02_FULL_57_47]|nr:MAG: aminodeoxychorismate synthase, component I [Gallionellales bacterium RIFCSPLOWO2_02_FULL_57_47]OGT14870.1 MAG: aminodeoxychorismate synthase, component I [Gallionellales bacterium RIFCSPHIGHO2_02_FULL_57_16]